MRMKNNLKNFHYGVNIIEGWHRGKHMRAIVEEIA